MVSSRCSISDKAGENRHFLSGVGIDKAICNLLFGRCPTLCKIIAKIVRMLLESNG